MGREFQIRGHRLPTDASDAPWLLLMDYLSFSAKARFTSDGDGSSVRPQAFGVYLGGPLTKDVSGFVQYDPYDRGAGPKSQFGEAYVQYNAASDDDSYGWIRTGRITPYLIYAASGGGRVTLSRPRVIDQPLGGGNQYSPRRRGEGVSAGYAGKSGLRVEAGVVSGSGLANLSDVFVTVEQHLDRFGSGIGLYGYGGRAAISAVMGPSALPAWQDRFVQWGLLGQYQREDVAISGAVFQSTNRRFDGGKRHPTGFYAEAAYNLDPGLTSFIRYDHKDNDLTGTRPNAGAVIGLTYRLPDRGRAVIELGGMTTDTGYRRQLSFEVNWLY